jgi:hypothetical protein
MYIAETVGSFLAHVQRLPFSIPQGNFIQSLRDLIAATSDGNMAAFSRSVGLPKTTLWELIQGHFPPSLPFLLRLCVQFRRSLLQLLVGVENTTPGNPPSSQEQTQKRDMRSPFDRNKVQQALEKILVDQKSSSPSMREVAQRLGYPVRTIETYFPIPCREISRRYAECRKQQGQLRKAHLRQRIHGAAHIALTRGLNPTYQRVGSILGEPGCFREYEARCALHDIRCQQDEVVALVDVVRSGRNTNHANKLAD